MNLKFLVSFLVLSSAEGSEGKGLSLNFGRSNMDQQKLKHFIQNFIQIFNVIHVIAGILQIRFLRSGC